MKKTVILVLLLLLAYKSQASHFSGGEVRYEFNGTNYTVHVTLYKLCVANSVELLNSVNVSFQSLSTSKSFVRTIGLVNFDTVNINCPGTLSSCIDVTSPIIGYIAGYYKDTVSIPVANDWVISCNNELRIAGIVNLDISSNQVAMYLETKMDNTAAINSNPLIASIPTYYMTAGNSVNVPLQVVDPEGDSVVFTPINPLCGRIGTIPYNTGYSVTNPFGVGGTFGINNTTKMLTMMSPSTGYYVIAFRVIEYRNGNIVGNYIRDLMVVVMPGTTALTFPSPNFGSIFSVYTCPGQSNSVTINFNDPKITDSVFVTVIPPILSGWTFASSSTNSLGAASTTISWTTPTTLNPAKLPHFFIRIRTRDNACPNASADFGLIVRTRQCVADSVWPGDANGDFTVNIYDPLAIAVATGQTGATRTGATTLWTAQACTPWTNSFVTNNTNMKHADCDGNGIVNSSDLGAITTNWSLSHPKSTATGPYHKTTGLPDLYLDTTGIVFNAGSIVSIPIKLGSTASPMNDIYGLTSSFTIDGITLSAAPTITYASSWLGNTTNTLHFTKSTNNNTIDWAYARTNQTNISGQGVIAHLNIEIPANTQIHTPFEIRIDSQKTVMIDYRGLPLSGYNLNNMNAITEAPVSVQQIGTNNTDIQVIPNPSVNAAVLQFYIQQTNTSVDVTITDVAGKLVWKHNDIKQNGKQSINLPSELNSGIYIISVKTDGNNSFLPVKWVKE